MFNKKASLFVLSLVAMGLASCGGGDSADLTYWCPNGDNAVMAKLVENFKASNAEYANLNIKLKANYGEGDTYAALHKDLDAAAATPGSLALRAGPRYSPAAGASMGVSASRPMSSSSMARLTARLRCAPDHGIQERRDDQKSPLEV